LTWTSLGGRSYFDQSRYAFHKWLSDEKTTHKKSTQQFWPKHPIIPEILAISASSLFSWTIRDEDTVFFACQKLFNLFKQSLNEWPRSLLVPIPFKFLKDCPKEKSLIFKFHKRLPNIPQMKLHFNSDKWTRFINSKTIRKMAIERLENEKWLANVARAINGCRNKHISILQETLSSSSYICYKKRLIQHCITYNFLHPQLRNMWVD
jgi:hypothetical protein